VNVDESNVQCVSDIQAIDEVKCPTIFLRILNPIKKYKNQDHFELFNNTYAAAASNKPQASFGA
jgi:hypothetical protein